MSLPGADELFRRTVDGARPHALEPVPDAPDDEVEQGAAAALAPAPEPDEGQGPRHKRSRAASGRVKHDEKMTIYVTADELMDIEHARLELRRTLGSAVDRGRLVRAAVALALADLDEHGVDSELVHRLSESP